MNITTIQKIQRVVVQGTICLNAGPMLGQYTYVLMQCRFNVLYIDQAIRPEII